MKNLTETVLPQGTTQLLRLTPWEYIDLPTEISGRVGYTIPKNVTFKFIFDNDYLDSISGAEKIDDETAISKRVMQWTDTHATVLADGSRVNQPGWFTGHYIYLKNVPLNQEIPIKIEYYINYEEDGQKLLDTKTIYIQLDPVEFRNGGFVRFHRVGDRDWFHGDLARINPEEADMPVESANAKFYAFFNDKLYYIKEDMMNQGMLFSNEIWNENNGSEPGKTNGGMVTEIKEIKAELKSEGEYFKSLIFSSFNGNSEEDKNKAKIMMALTYLNRYYGIEYGDFNIKNMMMFKPDFYAKTPSVIDRLIRIGSQEKNLKGDRTQDAYREIIAGDTGKGDLRSFLDYNMRLFTNDTDLNDWFIHSAKNVYVVEPETTNPDPDKLQTREQIDHYMKNYNDALMMLDHLEADAVLPQLNGNTSRWFKKMDRQYRSGNSGHQFDKIRELTEDEKKVVISTIDDLITNNLMTKHGAPGDGTYNPTDFSSAYVNMNMMTGIYGGNTSQGAPGAASFKHNTFRMWGYFGYENGFVGYASSKYQGAANSENKGLLGDDFIIKKVSNGRFTNLEDWKKEWFREVKAKADKGFTAIEIDGKQITNYAELKVLFDKAVEADLAGGGTAKTVELKSKVFKALLKNTDGFSGNLFKA